MYLRETRLSIAGVRPQQVAEAMRADNQPGEKSGCAEPRRLRLEARAQRQWRGTTEDTKEVPPVRREENGAS